MNKICLFCNKEIDNNAKFCRYCGKSFDNNLSDCSDETILSNRKHHFRVKLLITSLILLIITILITVFFLLKKSTPTRIVEAFENTINAESFSCDITFIDSKRIIPADVEIIGKNNSFLVYTQFKDREYSYINKYEYYYDGEYEEFHKDIISTENKDIIDALANRDIRSLSHSDFWDIKYVLEEAGVSYDSFILLLQDMMSDFYDNDMKSDFIKNYSERKGNYSFEVDIKRFLKSARKDYNVPINNIFRYTAGTLKIDFTIENNKISSLSTKLENNYLDLIGITFDFSNYNDISENNNRALELKKKVEENT